jgi:monofunctional biosynthetic peptidoglycan transglycosylase
VIRPNRRRETRSRHGSHRVRRTLAGAILAIGGVTVAYGAYVYLTLPDVRPLKTKNPTTTAFMALREQEYTKRDGRKPRKHQTWVSLRRISSHLVNAVLLAEDAGFYHHDGVDYHELWESMKINWRNRKVRRGASTITQQLAKNLYLSPERTVTRKFRELLITRRLEQELDKRRILELYLNVVEWGPHLYGVEQAAQTYFGVSAKELTPAQSATLAGMLINPIRHTPLAPSSRLARRKRIILDRMVRYEKITQEEYHIALGLAPPAPDRPVPEAETTPAAQPPALVESPDDGLAEDEAAPEPPLDAVVPPMELTEPPADLTEPPPALPTSPSAPTEKPIGR